MVNSQLQTWTMASESRFNLLAVTTHSLQGNSPHHLLHSANASPQISVPRPGREPGTFSTQLSHCLCGHLVNTDICIYIYMHNEWIGWALDANWTTPHQNLTTWDKIENYDNFTRETISMCDPNGFDKPHGSMVWTATSLQWLINKKVRK